jgi:hypothetical protein
MTPMGSGRGGIRSGGVIPYAHAELSQDHDPPDHDTSLS